MAGGRRAGSRERAGRRERQPLSIRGVVLLLAWAVLPACGPSNADEDVDAVRLTLRSCGMDRSEEAGLDDITVVVTLPANARPEAPSVAMRASLQMLRENVEYGDDAVVARVLIAGGADVGARACAVAEVIDPDGVGSWAVDFVRAE
jgi:hypothetical protein